MCGRARTFPFAVSKCVHKTHAVTVMVSFPAEVDLCSRYLTLYEGKNINGVCIAVCQEATAMLMNANELISHSLVIFSGKIGKVNLPTTYS